MASKYIDQEWNVFTVGEEPVVKGFLGAAIQVLYGVTQVPQGLIRLRLGGTFQVLIGGVQGSGWGVDDIEVTNTLVVSQCNHPPIVKDDTANTTTAKAVTIAVLANDFDPDGDPITVSAVTKPARSRNSENILNRRVSLSSTTIRPTPNGSHILLLLNSFT